MQESTEFDNQVCFPAIDTLLLTCNATLGPRINPDDCKVLIDFYHLPDYMFFERASLLYLSNSSASPCDITPFCTALFLHHQLISSNNHHGFQTSPPERFRHFQEPSNLLS